MRPGRFSRSRLSQAAAAPGVQKVMPLYVGFRLWRHPETGSRRELLVLGIDPRNQPLRLPEVVARASDLQQPATVLIDRLTQPKYGPQATGVVTEIGPRRMQLIGQYTLGTGFVTEGAVIASDHTFSQISASSPSSDVSLGLV